MGYGPAMPIDEPKRLATLEALNILDSTSEPAFDDLVALAALICQTPLAAVSLVHEHRTWSKATFGFEVSEAPRATSFRTHAIQRESVMMVEDTRIDDRFAKNPFVIEDPKIRFYAGAPLVMTNG